MIKLDDTIQRGKEGGEGVLVMMAYTERLFQASGNSNIRGLAGFTS